MIPEFHLGPFANEYPPSLWAIIVAFAIIAYAFVRVALPKIKVLLNDRTDRIEAAQKLLEKAMADLQSQHDLYAARIANIEAEARAASERAVQEAAAAHDELLAEARTMVDAMLARAKAEIAREEARTRIELRRDVVRIAMDSAEAGIRAHASETAHSSLIDDFIGAVQQPTGGGSR